MCLSPIFLFFEHTTTECYMPKQPKQQQPQPDPYPEEEVALDSLEVMDPGSSTEEDNEGDELEDIEE